MQLTDDIGLPPIAGADLALAMVWFVLGFALYAFVFAAAASLVNKITEVTSAITPVSTTLLVAYLLSVLVVTSDPDSVWSMALSLFPLTAPLAMPVRWASGEVPVWQLVLAMLLTAATAVLFVRIASSIYGRALLVTGHRVRLRELLGGARRLDRPALAELALLPSVGSPSSSPSVASFVRAISRSSSSGNGAAPARGRRARAGAPRAPGRRTRDP